MSIIITCSLMEVFWRMPAIGPALGVTPALEQVLHNSARCAPPRSAAIADSHESSQTSTVGLLLMMRALAAAACAVAVSERSSTQKEYCRLN